MARRVRPRADEDPSDEDIERFGGVTRTCPECRTEVYDDAEVCWKCGHAFMGTSARTSRATRWVVVIIIVLVIVLAVTQIL